MYVTRQPEGSIRPADDIHVVRTGLIIYIQSIAFDYNTTLNDFKSCAAELVP
jgi:hypothetical protein